MRSLLWLWLLASLPAFAANQLAGTSDGGHSLNPNASVNVGAGLSAAGGTLTVTSAPVAASQPTFPWNDQSGVGPFGAYFLQATDAGVNVLFTGRNAVLYIPQEAGSGARPAVNFPLGTVIYITNAGPGFMTVQSANATVPAVITAGTNIIGVGQRCTLVKYASNTWQLNGDMYAASAASAAAATTAGFAANAAALGGLAATAAAVPNTIVARDATGTIAGTLNGNLVPGADGQLYITTGAVAGWANVPTWNQDTTGTAANASALGGMAGTTAPVPNSVPILDGNGMLTAAGLNAGGATLTGVLIVPSTSFGGLLQISSGAGNQRLYIGDTATPTAILVDAGVRTINFYCVTGQSTYVGALGYYGNLYGLATNAITSESCTGSAGSLSSACTVGEGGTGLTVSGAAGYVLTSNGSTWYAAPLPSGLPASSATTNGAFLISNGSLGAWGATATTLRVTGALVAGSGSINGGLLAGSTTLASLSVTGGLTVSGVAYSAAGTLVQWSYATGAFTLAGTEGGYAIAMSVSGATAVTVSIPTDGTFNFPIGTQIVVVQEGTAPIVIAAVTPGTTTVNSTGAIPTAPQTRIQYAEVVLQKRAANIWYVAGDLK